ncbi:MAG: penicillin-binding transpeptidase domain-containing protein, partial [Patescibacteria group bacterium]
ETLKKILPKKFGNISAPHFVMYIRSLLIERYGQKVVEGKGLRVITTLDWDKQQIAEEEVKRGVDARGKSYHFSNAALVSIDPKTGQVLALVGSKDFFDDAHDGQVNVALRPRQPGSSFKPIVYAAGFIKGYTPEMTLWDVNTVFKTESKNYEPKDYDLKERGPVSVRQALQGSLNIPAVKMLYLVGVSRVLDFAEALGYSTFGDRSRFGLSLVLGGGEVKLLDHANSYAAFAHNGVQMPIATILKVEDAEGKTLQEWAAPHGHNVMDPNIAYVISNILSDNDARAYIFGAKNYLTLPGRPAAVKTGTTNNFHDAWALGYTPSLVTGVWVGNNDNAEMKKGADGSQIAAPIWQGYMKRALHKTPIESFPAPTPTPRDFKPVLLGGAYEAKIKIDAVSGKRATTLTPPDAIVEKTFRDAHEILFYLDKDDPHGPVPEDPTRDPQYANWESAVREWVQRTNWITATSTPPSEFDDVHTTENKPIVTIGSPTPNQEWKNRAQSVAATVIASRRIARMEAYSEGNLLGAKFSEPWTIPIQFPNAIDRGFHDLEVIATDDVGNRGNATVTINLNADAASLSLGVIDPATGSHIASGKFPVAVILLVTDLSNAAKIDLYIQTPDGSTRLLVSELAPKKKTMTFPWATSPGPGTYVIFPVLVDTSGNTHPGERTTIIVE